MSSFVHKYGTDDPRLGNLIKEFSPNSSWDVAILGFPHDEGVRRNGGRVGAAKGPDTIRTLISRIGTLYNSEYDVDISQLRVADAGNVDKNLTLDAAHDALRETVEDLVKRGIIPFVIGGGNDQSYANAKGMLLGLLATGEAHSGVTVINIDAHLDVRPLTSNNEAHSGSPFRQLCEDTLFRSVGGNLIEFGAQGHQCSQEHWNYVLKESGGKIYSLKFLRSQNVSISTHFQEVLEKGGDAIFVSFDIDAISSGDCPGVSAPATVGLTAQEALEICYEAGRNSKVKLVDVSEFNPDVESYRTGRLVCLMFYFFLMGYAQRKT